MSLVAPSGGAIFLFLRKVDVMKKPFRVLYHSFRFLFWFVILPLGGWKCAELSSPTMLPAWNCVGSKTARVEMVDDKENAESPEEPKPKTVEVTAFQGDTKVLQPLRSAELANSQKEFEAVKRENEHLKALLRQARTVLLNYKKLEDELKADLESIPLRVCK